MGCMLSCTRNTSRNSSTSADTMIEIDRTTISEYSLCNHYQFLFSNDIVVDTKHTKVSRTFRRHKLSEINGSTLLDPLLPSDALSAVSKVPSCSSSSEVNIRNVEYSPEGQQLNDSDLTLINTRGAPSPLVHRSCNMRTVKAKSALHTLRDTEKCMSSLGDAEPLLPSMSTMRRSPVHLSESERNEMINKRKPLSPSSASRFLHQLSNPDIEGSTNDPVYSETTLSFGSFANSSIVISSDSTFV